MDPSPPPEPVRAPVPATSAPSSHRRPRRRQTLPLLLGAVLLTVALPARSPALQADPGPATQASDIWNPTLLRQAGLDPERLHCNARVNWVPDLRQQVGEVADQILRKLPANALTNPTQRQHFRDEVAEIVFWRMVRVTIVDSDNHNVGVLPLKGFQWRDAAGVSHPLLVFRSAITRITPGAPSCVGSLLRDGGVRHVVNLYDAERIPIGELLKEEEQLSRSCRATYLPPQEANRRYGSWRERLRQSPAGSAGHRQAMGDLARLIREQILAPDGRPPQGNIYLHCGGGMHRSGMVMGILDRCVNGASMAEVTRRYLWHTAWRSPQQPGGAEQGNVDVIASFDCSSLGPLPGAPPMPGSPTAPTRSGLPTTGAATASLRQKTLQVSGQG